MAAGAALTKLDLLLRRLPLGVKNVARAIAERPERLRVWWWRRRHRYEKPIPNLILRGRIGMGTSVGRFVSTGRVEAAKLLESFAAQGAPIEPGARFLDFGCGCGRVLVHLPGVDGEPGPEIHGCDVDREAIEWNARAFPGASFAVSSFFPPLPYPDAHFDRIYSLSIFTHLGEAVQDAWLPEIARVLAPDGLALLTTLGRVGFEGLAAGTNTSHPREFTRPLQGMDFDAAGLLFLPYEINRRNRHNFPGIQGAFGLTLQTQDYVAERWSRFLDVVDHLEDQTMAQDFVFVRRPTDGFAPAADARAARASRAS